MGPVGIIVADPFCEPGPQFRTSLERMQIDALVLQAAPQPLDEHIVHPPAAAVHRDTYRHEVSRGLLWQWRDAQRREELVGQPAFLPMRVLTAPEPLPAPLPGDMAAEAATTVSRPAGIAPPASTAAATVSMMSSDTCDQGDGAGCMPGTARPAVTSSANHAADQGSGNSAAAASGNVQPSQGGSGVAVTDDCSAHPIRGGGPSLIGQRVLAQGSQPTKASA